MRQNYASPMTKAKPLRPATRKGGSRWNIPHIDFLTPRLQRGRNVEAIGFVTNLPGTDRGNTEVKT